MINPKSTTHVSPIYVAVELTTLTQLAECIPNTAVRFIPAICCLVFFACLLFFVFFNFFWL